MKEALILIDIQNMYFRNNGMLLFEPEKAAAQAAKILARFREEGKPVIHIQHQFNIEGKENGSYLLEFNEAVKPLADEIVLPKMKPNAFLRTGLKAKLDELGVDSLVVVGMMTHMCIDTTVRASQDFDYKVTLVGDACTTRDLKWNDEVIPAMTVHNAILSSIDKKFADVVSCEEFLK